MSDQADSAVMDIADLADSLIEQEPIPDDEEDSQPQAADEEAEEAPQEATDEESQPQDPQLHRVKVKNEWGADEEKDLTLEELAQGYMLQADYSRKTQAIPQQVQQQVAQHVQQISQQSIGQIEQLQLLVYQMVAPELQGFSHQLAATDPAEYIRLQALQQQVNGLLSHLDQTKQAAQQQAKQAEQAEREQAIRHSIGYLKANVEGWSDEKYHKTLEFGAKAYGFTKAELEQVIDGRAIHLLHDAMQFRAAKQQVPEQMKKVAAAPKVIKPAAPKPNNAKAEATKRLKASGRIEDLANFF